MDELVEKVSRLAAQDWWDVGREMHEIKGETRCYVASKVVLERIIATRLIEAFGCPVPSDPVNDQLMLMRMQREREADRPSDSPVAGDTLPADGG